MNAKTIHWVTTVSFGVPVFYALYKLCTDRIRMRLRDLYLKDTMLALSCALPVVGVYFAYHLLTPPGVALKTIIGMVWLGLPLGLLGVRHEGSAPLPRWAEPALLLWIGLPVTLRLLGARTVPPGAVTPYDFALETILGSMVLLFIFACAADPTDRKINTPENRSLLIDVPVMVVITLYMVIVVAVIVGGLATSFLHVPHISQNGAVADFLRFLKTFILVFVGVGLFEELLFRVGVQGYLQRVTNSTWKALVVTSVLFGLWHFWRNPPLVDGHPVLPLWEFRMKYFVVSAFAGLGYGLTYRLSTSFWYAVLLHALTDATWHAYLRAW